MRNLINELLNYSRLSAESRYEITSVKQVVNEILQDLELRVVSKKAVIQVNEIPDIEAIPGQIRHVFQNLISNALKFTREDVHPIITVSGERISELNFNSRPDPLGPYCKITVSDNGIGFNEIYLDKVFTIFQRLNPPEAFEGTGIGLAIVKKIVDRHSGIITAKSKEGQGASFVVIFPVKQEINIAARIL
jgi:signal transduction histidine kinase